LISTSQEFITRKEVELILLILLCSFGPFWVCRYNRIPIVLLGLRTIFKTDIFKLLNISGTPEPICMQWTNQTIRREGNSVCCNTRIAEADATKTYWLNNVHTVRNLGLPKQTIKEMNCASSFHI